MKNGKNPRENCYFQSHASVFCPLKGLKRPRGQSVCVFFCESAPGRQKYRILRCLGRPGCPKKAFLFSVAGAPLQKKFDFRSRYVCLFVPVLRATTTISKSMCAFVCNPCVCMCFVQSVCVFVCNPCVFLWPIFYCKLRGFWGIPKIADV